MSEQFGRKIRIIGKYFSVCVHGFLQENMITINLVNKRVLELTGKSKNKHFP